PKYFDNSTLSKKFVEEYTLSKGYSPGIGAALTYDTAQVVFRAIEQAKGLSGQKIRQSLSQVKYYGVTGRIQFDEQGNADRDIKILKQQNGKLILLN
ncbi:MAG: ABC transporter substrate-binding protein, partial [Kangiellaceae bacterium]|nr:ABC transporter substrate-binding protein [Kangiellaceae bacterium]